MKKYMINGEWYEAPCLSVALGLAVVLTQLREAA